MSAADCPGAGKCHGCLVWCDACGVVEYVCDSRPCDSHPNRDELAEAEAALADAEQELMYRRQEAARWMKERDEAAARVHLLKTGKPGKVPELVDVDLLQARVVELLAAINVPETKNFARAIILEAAHQRARWSRSDRHKSAYDWGGLICMLAGKAVHGTRHDRDSGTNADKEAEQTAHRIITVAATALNWFVAIGGKVPTVDDVDRELGR